jgi:CheY-like chemotaxis protein
MSDSRMRAARRILVVEDNQDSADTLNLLLELRGHNVRVARTGAEGLRMAHEWKPDIVLADLGLPILDGFSLAKRLRPTGVRMIAITGYGGDEFRREASACGFEQFLVKPPDLGQLMQLVESA